MAMDMAAQRLQLGDVVLINQAGQGDIEATVARNIVRTAESVTAVLRAEGRDDFVKEWAVDELVTVIRGP